MSPSTTFKALLVGMFMILYLIQAFIYLGAAVLIVPLAKRLGLGSVLGFLVAGIIIGPIISLLGGQPVHLQEFAELGVVIMLFLIGLELEPRMLWALKHRLIGLGGLQVVFTILMVFALAIAFNVKWQIALVMAFIFSLSSTAIVLQLFDEQRLTKTQGGINTFSVLLMQDILVIPMMAVIPLLSSQPLSTHEILPSSEAQALTNVLMAIHSLPDWQYAGVLVLTIGIVIFGGRFISRPLFHYVARSNLREVFTAVALMIIIGVSALMSVVGLSPALGSFLAGVVLANSEFKKELEVNLAPFKGLLMGLFFITVGAGIHFETLIANMNWVFALTIGLIVIKFALMFLIGKLFKLPISDRWLMSLSLAQAGEFGFVLLSFALTQAVLPKAVADVLSLVVALSMCIAPLLFVVYQKWLLPFYEAQKNSQVDNDPIDHPSPVIIAGVGRFGQIVNRFLRSSGFETIAIDHQSHNVELMRQVNIRGFYGDASHPDLLYAAGIREAKLLVIAFDDKEQAVTLVKYIKKTYPKVPVFARAFDRQHYFELYQAGADFIVSETYFSALELGKEALKTLNVHPFIAMQKKTAFAETEATFRKKLYEKWKEADGDKQFQASYTALFLEIEAILAEQMQTIHSQDMPAHRSEKYRPEK
ncbi:MAG: cation:proton antiporter [Cellvibrionales bacterium]|nr:cation:proton antiporter [Cellvibrionales bacterium]